MADPTEEEPLPPLVDEIDDAAEIMERLRAIGLSKCSCHKYPPCHWCVEGWKQDAVEQGLAR